jgi:hypothetical protein
MEETQVGMQALVEGAGGLQSWEEGEGQRKRGGEEDTTDGLPMEADEEGLRDEGHGKEAGCNGKQASLKAESLKAEMLQQVN